MHESHVVPTAIARFMGAGLSVLGTENVSPGNRVQTAIGSYEQENLLVTPLGANIAQIKDQTSTDGVEFMDSAQDALICALRSIRDQADSVLAKIEQSSRKRSLGWKCAACG